MGTTPEILAPYLPYGIELRLTKDCYAELCGLSIELRAAGGWVVEVQHGRSTKAPLPEGLLEALYVPHYHSITEVLPLLRPFAALALPLPDGTVPAVEVAKRLLDLLLTM